MKTNCPALRQSLTDIYRLLCEVEKITAAGRVELEVAGDRFTAANFQTVRSHLMTAIAHVEIAGKFLL
jgi:hypothetical protein